jgi:hypothetical protein
VRNERGWDIVKIKDIVGSVEFLNKRRVQKEEIIFEML